MRRSKVRHAGHLDALRPAGELWNGQNTQPLGIAAVVTVDTTTEVDVPALVAAIRAAADAS